MLFPLVTLLLAVLGIPFTVGCVILLLLGAQWYILFNVIAGARAIPDDLKEVAQAYGMTRLQRWTRLYIPCVFPYLVTGLITAAGVPGMRPSFRSMSSYKGTPLRPSAWLDHQPGYRRRSLPLLCASVVTMASCVVLVNRLFWKRLYRLAENRYSLNA
jgi:NitT/TauT family transport system permease protein